jgi:glycosyltransferase involved in cell wall biosynthesis
MLPTARNGGRVLMTADAVGGVWQYAVELAAGLARTGIETVLAVMGQPPAPAQLRQAAAAGAVVVDAAYRLEWMPGAERDLPAAAAWLQRLSARFAPDIIHLNGYALASPERSAPLVIVAHSCVCSWWRAVHGVAAPADWQGYALRTGRGLRAADVVVAPSRTFLAMIEREYGALPATAVVPNGRDPGQYRAAPKEPLVFAAGRLWDKAKNIAALEAAATGLRWPCHVAGPTIAPDGSEAFQPRALRHVGVLDDAGMREWLARAAIFAAPALYEPFGLTALEAALSGCALVLADIPTYRELWPGAALFVDPSRPHTLRAAIDRLIDNPQEQARLADAAAVCARRFRTQTMVDGYRQAYADAAERWLRSAGALRSMRTPSARQEATL